MTDQISTNPKKAMGAAKVQLQCVPPALAIGAAVSLGEGVPKYGAYNWREKPVDASTYIGAIERHLCAYKDGEDIDPESAVGKTHLEGIAGCIAILLDAISLGTLIDDRTKGNAAQLIRDTNARLAAFAAKAAKPDGTLLAAKALTDQADRAEEDRARAILGNVVEKIEEVPRTPMTMTEVYDLPDGTAIEVQWHHGQFWGRGHKGRNLLNGQPTFTDGNGAVQQLTRVTSTGAGTKVRRAA